MTSVACGADKSGSSAASSADSAAPTAPTPSGLTGTWKADPGQADRVQQKLTAKGFQCSRSSETHLDLRLCSASKRSKDAWGDETIGQGVLRYVSDAQGTVVFFNMWTAGIDSDKRAYSKMLAEAVLPATDAAVYTAGGDKLEWGTVAGYGDGSSYIAAKGWTPAQSLTPSAMPLKVTKEKALAPLQAAKLECKFSDSDAWANERKAVACTDPAYKVKDPDGSIEGAIAELAAVDAGPGISSVQLYGAHSKAMTENIRGVKLLIPRAAAIDPSLKVATTWLDKNLDGLPHAAYVGPWLVRTTVALGGGIADWPFVRAAIELEKPNLGLKIKTSSDGPGESDSASDTPSN